MNSFTVYLVRHGSTMLNSFNRMQGWIDSDLSDSWSSKLGQAAEKFIRCYLTALFLRLGRAISTRNIILNQPTRHREVN